MARGEPLNIWERVHRYLNQTGRGYLTPKQSRRCRQKDNRHLNGGAQYVPGDTVTVTDGE